MDKKFIDKSYNYAIVGASKNPEKYGYRILLDMKTSGYHVFPVNLKERSILGLKAYKSLAEITGRIDVVILVVPPEVSVQILFKIKELNIRKVWFQPGSESQEAIQFCRKNNINFVHNQCIMLG